MIAPLVVTLSLLSAPRDASPIILMPGFYGWARFPVFGAYFRDVKEALEQDGFVVYEVAPPPIASIHERGRFLLRFIDDVKAKTGADKVHVIAHSQGGVDTRVALSLGGASSIASVVTLASPHRGTGLADHSLLLPQELVSLALGAAAIGSQWSQGIDVTTPDAPGVLQSLALRSERPRAAARVPCFSVAGLAGADVDGSCRGGAWSTPVGKDNLHPLFGWTHEMNRQVLGRRSDDGVVPTASMRFGRFLGCAPTDHVGWMGWRIGNFTGDGYVEFDHVAFIVELARGLADVERAGSADGMNAHLPRLAKLAHAVYLGAPPEVAIDDAVLQRR
jgi:triacylglycerol lipase